MILSHLILLILSVVLHLILSRVSFFWALHSENSLTYIRVLITQSVYLFSCIPEVKNKSFVEMTNTLISSIKKLRAKLS